MKTQKLTARPKSLESLNNNKKTRHSQDSENTHSQDSAIPPKTHVLNKKTDIQSMGAKKLKKNLQWSKWYLLNDKRNGQPIKVIKRYAKEDGKTVWENYDRSQYVGLKDSELTAFVTRLNGEFEAALKRAKQAYEIKHTFITPKLLQLWETEVIDGQASQKIAYTIINAVQKYFLHFFVEKMKLTDPLQWYEKQAVWGKVLLNEKPKDMSKAEWESIRLLEDGEQWSGKTIKDFVMFANRFIKFLHKKSPGLFPLLIFEPIPKAVLRKHEADRILANKTKKKHYIRDEHWTIIQKELDPDILPFVKLAYLLGLRDAETLGVSLDDVGTEYFELQRQLVSFPDGEKPVFGPPKSRKVRNIPYWNTSPKEIYLLIKDLPKLMHPNTLARKFSEEMKRLKMPYGMHDLRRTWITKTLHSGIDLIKVKEAAGHAQISTTNLYLVNPDSIKNKRFKLE